MWQISGRYHGQERTYTRDTYAGALRIGTCLLWAGCGCPKTQQVVTRQGDTTTLANPAATCTVIIQPTPF